MMNNHKSLIVTHMKHGETESNRASHNTKIKIDPIYWIRRDVEKELEAGYDRGKTLMKDGKWLVPEDERPHGWQELLCWQGATNERDESITRPVGFNEP